jgi:hypothetical protein
LAGKGCARRNPTMRPRRPCGRITLRSGRLTGCQGDRPGGNVSALPVHKAIQVAQATPHPPPSLQCSKRPPVPRCCRNAPFSPGMGHPAARLARLHLGGFLPVRFRASTLQKPMLDIWRDLAGTELPLLEPRTGWFTTSSAAGGGKWIRSSLLTSMLASNWDQVSSRLA